MGMQPGQGRLAGTGRDFWDTCLLWLWSHVPGADAARSGSLPSLPKSRWLHTSYVISS